jgi:two-component system OmpR family response regulator
MRHAGKVVARTTLLHNVWGYGFELGTNVIDVHISELRRRLDRPGEPSFIRTIRCVGYIVGHAPVA